MLLVHAASSLAFAGRPSAKKRFRVAEVLTTRLSTDPRWTNSIDRVVRFRALNSAGNASSRSENRWTFHPVVSGAAGEHVAATHASSGRGAVSGRGALLQLTVRQRTASSAHTGELNEAR